MIGLIAVLRRTSNISSAAASSAASITDSVKGSAIDPRHASRGRPDRISGPSARRITISSSRMPKRSGM
jgi:hypothetical protein